MKKENEVEVDFMISMKFPLSEADVKLSLKCFEMVNKGSNNIGSTSFKLVSLILVYFGMLRGEL